MNRALRLLLLVTALAVLPGSRAAREYAKAPTAEQPVFSPLHAVAQLPPAPVLAPPAKPLPPEQQYRQPADAYLLAYRDCQRLPKYLQPHIRYFEVWDGDPKLKWSRWVAVSGLVQAHSLSQRIVPATLVLEDGTALFFQQMKQQHWQQVALFRICLLDYNQTSEQWDKLADPRLEHRFHAFTYAHYPAGVNPDGSKYPAGKGQVAVVAPWLFDPLGLPKEQPAGDIAARQYEEAVIGLHQLTRSTVPVVEARNFVWQTSINFLRPAGYYSWLGIKDRDSFDKLVRRQKDSVVLRDSVADSRISQEPREIQRDGRGDGYWETHDQVDHFAQGIRNPLVPLARGKLRFDGFETFGHLDNGWWATGAFKNDGKNGGTALDSAPDGIGYNHGTTSNRGAIDVCLTCFGCHDMVPGNGGLQPFKPYFRTKYSDPGRLAGVFATKQDEFEYMTPFDPLADVDRRVYYSAVMQATGTEPHVWAAQLTSTYESWNRSVGLEDAAAELGVSSAGLVGALNQYLTMYGQLPDTINDNWTKPDKQRTRIGRQQWAEFYPNMQLVLRGLPPGYQWPEHKFDRLK